MASCLVVKLRPTTPWRIGANGGGVDSIYHSDTLYSAVTLAMERFGWLEEWIAATASGAELSAPGGCPAVRFSSCYPFLEDTLFIVPPKNLWPPPPTTRVRWKTARFVPVPLVERLLNNAGTRLRDEDGWTVDAESESLLPQKLARVRGIYRRVSRRTAAVDRVSGLSGAAQVTDCVEFAAGAGLWFVAVFGSEEGAATWRDRVKACLRYLADAGFGGKRTRGLGHAEQPEFEDGEFPGAFLKVEAAVPAAVEGAEGEAPAQPAAETAHWLLSLYWPAGEDQVDWRRGAYSVTMRSGRTAQSGELKQSTQMVAEGSVLFANEPPKGAAVDVAPEGYPHPVYRSGYALTIPIEWRVIV